MCFNYIYCLSFGLGTTGFSFHHINLNNCWIYILWSPRIYAHYQSIVMKKSFNLFVLILLLFPTYGQEIDLAPFPCDSLGGIDRRAYVDRNDPGLKACLEENMRKRTIAFQEDSLNVLMDLMWMYSVSFENQKVIDLKSQLIRSCVTLKDSIYVYNMMSYSYIGIEQYANARKELNEGLYIANRKGDKLLLFTLYLESLKQYRSINDSINLYKELEQLEELFPYADSLNLDQCSFYNIKATIYLDFGTDEQQKKSTKIAEKAVECYNGRDAKDQAAVAYEILANCYLNNKENGYLDRAEKATYNALGIYVAFNNRPMEGRMINLLGFIELDRGNINSAISYIKKSLAIAKEYNDLPFREDNLYKLGDAYAKQKKYKKAYEVSLELEQIKEQIESENNKTLFYNLEQQYKSKEKEQKIQLLNQEKTLNLQQRNLFVGLALFLLAMALLASYYFYRQRKLNNIITNQYTELQELNKFKDQLFSIIGHDLRNLVAKLNTDQRRLVRNTKKVENVSLHPLALKMGANT